MSGYLLFSVLVTSTSGFLFGFDVAASSYIQAMPSFIDHIIEGRPEAGRAVALCFTVAAAGASLCSGYISDRFGRRVSIIAGSSVFLMGSGMETAAENLLVFCIGRVLSGIGTGCMLATGPVYIAEASPRQMRGAMMAVFPFAISCGTALAPVVAYLCDQGMLNGDLPWRVVFALQSCLALIMLTFVMMIPDSPHWLLARSEYYNNNEEEDKAKQAYRQLRGRFHTTEPDDWESLRNAVRFDRVDMRNQGLGRNGDAGSWRALLARGTRLRFLLALAILALQQPSDITAILYYFPGVWRAADLHPDPQPVIGINLASSLMLVFSGIAVLVVDRVGRRPLIVLGSLTMAVAFAVMTVLVACRGVLPDSRALSIAYISVAYVAVAAGTVSWRTVGWVFPVEILPNRLRARAIAAAYAVYWLAQLAIVQMAPWLIRHMDWTMYAILTAVYLLVGSWAYLELPETSGLALERIDEVFHSSGKVWSRENTVSPVQ